MYGTQAAHRLPDSKGHLSGANSRRSSTRRPLCPERRTGRQLSIMHRFRSIWLALMGGAVIVTLSLSVALGADPADETDGNRGQTISGFVHSLIFAQDDPADDETVDEDQDEDEDSDEEDTEEDADEADEADEEDTEEDADDADEDTEADADTREVPEEFANHG